MLVNYPTIVTMFYEIRKMENSNVNDNRQKNKYLDLSKQFLLKLPYPLIIFTDENETELIETIHTERVKYMERTKIINVNLENTYFYKHLNKIEELQKKFVIHNGDLKHETPLYIVLNNNKFFFLETAINENPFNSSHFIWCDLGINHVSLDYEKIHEWILFVPDKIKQLCINPYIENVLSKDMFCNIYHHTAGGLFSGSKENLLKYCDLFKEKVEQIYSEDWYQIDEAIMTIVQRENPDLFELFYGDYKGIISNYLTPHHDIYLILISSQKAINHNKTNLAYNILNYCHSYFYNNINSGEIYKYISQRIIVDYYNNDKKIKVEVIFLINQKILNKDENIIHLLENNKSNLDFYLNKELILF
jgi:hypothetical protein